MMKRLLRYAWPYRGWIFTALVFMLLNSVTQVLGPLLTKMAVDRYLAPAKDLEPGPWDHYLSADPWTGITQLSGVYLAAMVVGMITTFVQQYLMTKTGQQVMFDLRRQLMGHLQRLDLSYYDKNPVGRMLTRVTTDVDALNELFASGLVAVLGDILVLAFLLAAMTNLSPGLTGLLLAVLPLVVLATVAFRKAVQSSYRRIRVAVARINAYLQEHITGIAVLQLFNREAKSGEEFEAINRQHMDAFKDSIHAYGWFYPVVEFCGTLGLAGLMVYGGYSIQQGGLTMGVLIAFFQYAMRFYRPIQDLSEKYNIFQSAMAAGERVFGLLETNAAIQAPATPRPFPAAAAAIEFDQVWFAYQGEDWVIRDLSFRIEPGETIAVVGHTGAGKTTLASLLLRFYDAQRGSIRIGGVDVKEMDPRQLRAPFSIVLQDPFLFTGDIGANIRLGTRRISEEEVREAARQVNLLEYVESLPEKFGHPVRERGAGLSTGQKQLVSFARALAHDPRFLILDEATSSVDTETEMRVRDALAKLLEGRTSIVIAHRLSTIQQADRIFVMHKGALRESGTHQQLLAQRGVYFKLYQLQYKDQEANSRLG
jgi:ATP-binding cassette subfamily B protein